MSGIENALNQCGIKIQSSQGDKKELGKKLDNGKARPTLLPLVALDEVIRVLEFGAQKYSPDNWRKVENAKQRYTDAMFRHALAYAKGEVLDDESNEHHLAHAICCAMFIVELEMEDKQ